MTGFDLTFGSVARILGIVVLAAALALLTSFKVRAMKSNDRKIDRFAPCGAAPNCASTETPEGDSHWIRPIAVTKSWSEARAILKSELAKMERVALSTDEPEYLHFEFRSWLFSFVDDVEFKYDEPTRTLRFRSASRVGYSDMGVNRKRMETIRSLLEGKI